MGKRRDGSWRRRVAAFAVYVGLGPLLGLVVFAVGVALLGWAQTGGRDALWAAPFLLIYGLLFTHWIGGPPAALAGLVSIALAWLIGRPAWWMGAVGGIAALAVMVGIKGLTGVIDTTNLRGALVTPSGMGLVLAAVNVIPAMICWTIAARILFPRSRT